MCCLRPCPTERLSPRFICCAERRNPALSSFRCFYCSHPSHTHSDSRRPASRPYGKLPALPSPSQPASQPPAANAPPHHPPGLNVGGMGISFSRGDTKVLSVQLQMNAALPHSPVQSASSIGSGGSGEARGLFGGSERSHGKLLISGDGVKLPHMLSSYNT